jgi:RNA polymerase sigma-70 factor (ECF subfamily)
MEKNDISDNALIAAVKNGDKRAFKGLVETYESQVSATIIGMLGTCPEAEEIGQETFIRFYNSIDEFRGDSGAGTFLTRIAINLSLNELKRRKKNRERFNDGIDLENISDADQDTEHLLNAKRIHNAILLLKPKWREVVVLRLVQGYTMKETSEILKLPLGTVLSRLFRAQKLLRIILDKKWGGQYG